MTWSPCTQVGGFGRGLIQQVPTLVIFGHFENWICWEKQALMLLPWPLNRSQLAQGFPVDQLPVGYPLGMQEQPNSHHWIRCPAASTKVDLLLPAAACGCLLPAAACCSLLLPAAGAAAGGCCCCCGAAVVLLQSNSLQSKKQTARHPFRNTSETANHNLI